MTSSLQQGIDAAKSGMMEQALAISKTRSWKNPKTPMFGSGFPPSLRMKKADHFPQEALEIDPANRPAQRGLAFIERKSTSAETW